MFKPNFFVKLLFLLAIFICGCKSVHKVSYPLDGGIVKKEQFGYIEENENTLEIVSPNDTVKSYVSGKVFSLIDAGDDMGIVIESNNCYYSFSNLVTTAVKKGSLVQIGDIIGTVKKNQRQYKVWLKKSCGNKVFTNKEIYAELSKIK